LKFGVKIVIKIKFNMGNKTILLESGDKRKIMDALRVTYPTIRKALRGESNTPLAQKIRGYAKKLGGVEKEKM
jgi:hypothetical protein